MFRPRALVLLLAARAADAYDFTNNKITTCARERRANGTAWLTASEHKYICTSEQFDKFYDPAHAIAYVAQNPGANTPAVVSCPDSRQTIKCFVFSSWGQVAGSPDACSDRCSTHMLEGANSCCGQACTAAAETSAQCDNNKWIVGATAECGTAFAGGYCDCCPNCYDCVHGPPVTTAPKRRHSRSLVDNRFCDCRNGLQLSSDYTPCWNSCLDCLGDDGDVSYMPEDVGEACIGKSECYIEVLAGADDASGNNWYHCTSSDPSSCTISSKGSVSIPNQSKFKAAALCG